MENGLRSGWLKRHLIPFLISVTHSGPAGLIHQVTYVGGSAHIQIALYKLESEQFWLRQCVHRGQRSGS